VTSAVNKPTPLVLFADPQKAINRSGYIPDSNTAYGEQHIRTKRNTRNREENKVIPYLVRMPSFDM
jgi:hypothetical protein